jgi:hypothetical protein
MKKLKKRPRRNKGLESHNNNNNNNNNNPIIPLIDQIVSEGNVLPQGIITRSPLQTWTG